MEDKDKFNTVKHLAFSWWARLMARFALSQVEHLSIGEKAVEAEDGQPSSASLVPFEQKKRLREILQAYRATERYPDEPELHFSRVIRQAREKEQRALEEQRQKRKFRQELLFQFQFKTLLLLLAFLLPFAVIFGGILVVWWYNGSNVMLFSLGCAFIGGVGGGFWLHMLEGMRVLKRKRARDVPRDRSLTLLETERKEEKQADTVHR